MVFHYDLILNAALLVVLSVFYVFLVQYRIAFPRLTKVAMGLMFGIISILLMNFPFQYSENVFLDGRSTALALSGLFGGWLVALIAAIMTTLFRFWLGGTGVFVGAGMIIFTAFLGVFVRKYLVDNYRIPRLSHLLIIAFGTSALVVITLFLLPLEQCVGAIDSIWGTLLFLFPGVTFFVGYLMISAEKRLAAEQELCKREALYRTTLYSIGDGVILTDVNMRVVNMNPAACKITDWNENAAKGQPVGNIFRIKSENALLQANGSVDNVLKDGKIVGLPNSSVLLSRTGTEIPIAESGAPVIDDEGRNIGVVLVFHDLAKEHKKQRELEESEEQFRRLFEKHKAVKLLIDPATGDLIGANEEAVRYYGWSKEELLKMNIAQINVVSPEIVPNEMKNAGCKERNYFQFRHRKADGSICDVEVFASNVEIKGKHVLHSIVHDVSEKKKIETELRLLSESVKQNPVGVIITDAAMGIKYVNPKYTEMTDLKLEDVAGKKPRIFQEESHRDNPDRYSEIINTISQKSIWIGEFRIRRKGDSIFWEKVTISPIEDDAGAVSNYVLLIENITATKEMMRDLEEAKLKAEEGERLKSAFLANMSHEIRTPLNGILGFTELLTSKTDLSSEKKQEYGSIVRKSTEGLLHIINDVLEVSRLESERTTIDEVPFILNDTLNTIFGLYQKKLADLGKDHLSFILKMPNRKIEVTGDENRLNQVLINLLDNAIKFTDKGQIVYGIASVKNGKVEMMVSDTGIGIPPEKQEIVFNRFSQANDQVGRKYGGTGLGLAIVKKLTSLMGEGIRLESEEGKGALFSFNLPGRFVE
jgi:PAS domain S-box-containing protein